MRSCGALSRASFVLSASIVVLAACGGAAAPASPSVGASAPAPAASSTVASAKPAASASTAASVSASAKPAARASTAASGAALPKIGGTVAVIGSWGGSEQESFLAMVKPFEDQTGTKVQYEGSRDLNAILQTRVQAGNPPDLAGLPGPGQMAQFAQAGKLVDLSNVVDVNQMKQQYAPDWLTLGTVNGKLVGIFIKAAIKSTIWYDPKNFSQVSRGAPPKTWDDLTSLSGNIAGTGKAPWCIGLESAVTSGWPGTDWISDIMMRSAGPDKYVDWYDGKLAWNSAEVKNAWQMWGKIVADPKMVYGGTQYMLATNFGNAGGPMFTTPPGCYMERQGNFITDFYVKNNPSVKPGADFTFFPFPDVNSQYSGVEQVAGDLFGMFKDTPQARALIKYLTTPEAQAIWVKRGGALSPNKQVAGGDYPDDISKNLAQTLTSAKTPRFSAGDMMPDAMTKAFYQGILNYVQKPDQLDSILMTLDNTRRTAYTASPPGSAKPSA
ncbi:MAG TPA: ABC transporter substrate-binding protein [Chloroflexota bacterium]|nr:ABC transporter substrate-binding protein [Chloroflexota bacterium]